MPISYVDTIARVNYSEIDQMGVVYHARYAVWLDVARTEYLRQAGMSYRELEGMGFFLVVGDLTMRYHRPARYDDELEIETTGELLSPVRLAFDYEILRGDARIVTGRTEHASLNPRGRPVRLPERVREYFA